MDPNEALRGLLVALDNGSTDIAVEYAEALARWIREGGFKPAALAAALAAVGEG